MKIFFAIAAALLLFGMIGDKDAENRKNFTFGFMAAVAGIIALCAFGI